MNSSFLLIVPFSSWLLGKSVVGGYFNVLRGLEVFACTLQAQVVYHVLPIWNNLMFCRCSPSLITSVVSIITHVYSTISDAKRMIMVVFEEKVNIL